MTKTKKEKREELSKEVKAKLLLTQMVGMLVANGIDLREVLNDAVNPRKRSGRNR